MPVDPASGVWFELRGEGHPLLIGLPLMASHAEVFGDGGALRDDYLAHLADRYRVCLVDYPGIGRSADMPPDSLTAERVCADLLSVADAAGFGRFAWFGYSWSGAVGLQLASRTDRLTALAIGGWPPLDAPYEAIHAAVRARIGNVPASAMTVLRTSHQYRQWSTFYASLDDWDEHAAVAAITCPALVVFGADGDLVEDGHPVPIASTIRRTRPRLEALGWEVVELPDQGHPVVMHADLVAPPLRAFLDRAVR